MKKFYLDSYSIQKSFYKKAQVEDWGGIKILISYKTAVAYIDTKKQLHRLWNDWSTTTQNHLNAFLYKYGLQNNLYGMNKKKWMNMEVENLPKNFKKMQTTFDMDNYKAEQEMKMWERMYKYA